MRHLAVAVLALAASLARAQGFMQVSDPDASQMTLKTHLVDVVIDNQVATTTVDQVFLNPNPGQIEATYLFPVPPGASMEKLSMWIDGQEQEAELLESGKARGIYEAIVRSRRDPALLEFAGAKTFRLRVFPINPGEEKRVKLTYSEALRADAGVVQYRYGLGTAKYSRAPLSEARVSVRVVSNVALKSVMSPTHAVDVARPDDHHATVAWEAANTSPNRDFQLFIAAQDGEFGMNLVAQRAAGEDGYFMMLLAPRVVPKSEAIRRDVCFVVDCSMSMAEDDRMAQAKKALKAGLQTLNRGDRFNIVRFSTEVTQWKESLVETTEDSLAEASKFADGLKARGGTNISDALETALAMNPRDARRPYMVLFMTDGAPTIGETEPDRILALAREKNAAGARVFTLGVGFDLDVRLLDRLADEHHGLRQYVTPTESLETRMAAYYEKFSAPVLAGAELKIEGAGVEIYDVYPKALSDVFKGQQIAVYGRFREAGQRKVRLTGTVDGETREYTWTADFPAASEAHDSVPRLWAVSKVGHLVDAMRLNGEQPELKAEVVALAREFGIVTPYTSFLVLEDSARVPAAAASPGEGGAGRFGGGRRNLRAPGGGNAAPAERKGAPADEPGVFFPDAEESDHNEAAKDDPAALKGDSGEFLNGLDARDRARGPTDALGVGSGSGGVRASREADAMKEGRGGESKAAKRIGDKTFYFARGVWRDADWKDGLETVKVEYLSDEYFKLTQEKPELAKFFAAGEAVTVVFEGKVYEVTATPAPK
ncbi:MAG: VWA domain-containing protein [Planctomycetia bacterium]|nr:VWA domain-containing protein [Planctomycetia bacterium]